MDNLSNEVIYAILDEIDEFATIVDIRPTSTIFNYYFLDRAKKITKIEINKKYINDHEMYNFIINKEEILFNNVSSLLNFPNIKILDIYTRFSHEASISEIMKYIPLHIESLDIYTDDTVDWNEFKKFSNLTHLYVYARMFIKYWYPDDYVYHSDSDSDDEPNCTLLDGSLNQSINKIISILENTKLYYIYMGNYDYDWSHISNVFLIKDKTPDFEGELAKLHEAGSRREFTYDIVGPSHDCRIRYDE